MLPCLAARTLRTVTTAMDDTRFLMVISANGARIVDYRDQNGCHKQEPTRELTTDELNQIAGGRPRAFRSPRRDHMFTPSVALKARFPH